MLWEVTKSGERTVRRLTPDEERAVREAVARREADEALALAVLRAVREREHWLACDCRREGGARALLAPCRLPEEAGFTWRVLSGEHRVHHAEACVFYRAQREREAEAAWERAARAAPEGYFAVLNERKHQGERLGGADAPGPGEPHRRRVPALSRLLLELMRSAGLTRIDADEADLRENAGRGRAIGAVLGALQSSARHYAVAPARALAPLFFTRRAAWDKKAVHAALGKAAKSWPAGHRPQAFICCLAGDVAREGLPATRTHAALPVTRGIQRPVIGRTAVSGPYLVIAVAGRTREDCQLMRGYAQPVVAFTCPVPVDSHFERQAFGTLRTTLAVLKHHFPGTAFVLDKPVFETQTARGPCLPDFLLRASAAGGREAVFVIEVMGFERPSYLKGKEVTHPRMAELGTLLLMHGDAFAGGGVGAEGRRITQAIAAELRAAGW